MLSRIRHLARPLGTFAVLVFLAPAAMVECRDISALAGDLLACCKPSGDGAGLRGDCCAVGGATAVPERPASTAPSARSASDAVTVSAGALSLVGPALAPAASLSEISDPAPPLDRLYIRFSVIRR